MKTVIKNSMVLSLTTLALLSGCGSTSVEEKGSSGFGQYDNPSPNPTVTVTPTPTGTSDPYNLGPYPAPMFQLTNYGTSSYSYTGSLDTNSALIVRFKALQAQHANGTGFTADYDCVSVTYTVQNMVNGSWIDGATYTTPLLKRSGASDNGCPGVDKYDANLSSAMVPNHTAVRIKVRGQNYDFYCKFYGNNCPSNPVYNTHNWNVSLETLLDGTHFQ